MISQVGRWTRTPSATPQPKKMKCSFLESANDLVNGLEPHLPPLSSQKNEMFIFGLHSTSDDWPGLVDGLKPHLPPHLQPKK